MDNKAKIILTFLLLAIGLMMISLASESSSARTITVDDSGGADHETIQDALNASDDGDTIQVREGVYRENVKIETSVSLVGDGWETTTIDGGWNTHTVWVKADWVNITGFTVTEGRDAGIHVRGARCRISGNNCSNNEYGIYFRSEANNGTIENNICSYNDNYGINLDLADYNSIEKNTCERNRWDGITLRYSMHNVVGNNTCRDNKGDGIHLYSQAHHNTIYRNICENNDDLGINLENSKHCTVRENTCRGNAFGMTLRSARYNRLEANQMTGEGLYIDGSKDIFWNTNDIANSNTVNGKPLYYYRNETGLTVPAGAGQVILANCSEITVKDQDCSDTTVGILAAYSDNLTITDNVCSGNVYYGIMLHHTRESTIEGNTCDDNEMGIYLYPESRRNTLTDNTCSGNDECGIYVGPLSDHNTLTGNSLSSNNGTGFFLYSIRHTIIRYNQMTNEGITLQGSYSYHWYSHTIDATNTINGRPVYYYVNTTDVMVPAGAGQVILVNCSSSVLDRVITDGPGGIVAALSTDLTINNNSCRDLRDGIYLFNIRGSTVSNNNCTGNRNGIHVYRVPYGHEYELSIHNNSCSDNSEYGMFLESVGRSAIDNNTCSGNGLGGLLLRGSVVNTFSFNSFSFNDEYGINFDDYLHIDQSVGNTLTNNTITGNRVGIFCLYGSTYPEANQAHYNYIFDNTDYGIEEPWSTIFNATLNWWGHGSGPYEETRNPDGKGDKVSRWLIFDPWLERPPTYLKPEAAIVSMSPSPAFTSDKVWFVGGGEVHGYIISYVWTSSLDGELHNGRESTFSRDDLSLGTHTISLRVLDNFGSWSEETTATLVVEAYVPPNEKPTISITSPKNDEELKGKVTISGTASDPGGLVERVEVSVNGGAWEIVTGIDSWNFEWDSSTVDNGEYVIRVRAFDGEDHSDEVTVNVTVENEKEDDNDAGFLPGFEVASVLLALVGGAAVVRKRKHSN